MSKNKSAQYKGDEPASLHRVMRDAIGQQLKTRYEVSEVIPHELLVLLMQINEQSRLPRAAHAKSSPK